MFLLAVIEDKLRTLPDQFARDSEAVLLDQIDIKFANKVLVDVGLCITLFDFLEVGDPYIYPAEGSAHQRVKFRMVVFRPFVGEILVGRISSSTKSGLWVSLEFFDEVFIPAHLLQSPSVWREDKALWVWNYDDSDASDDFVMNVGEQVRFKVRSIDFNRITNTSRGAVQITTTTTEMYSANNLSSSSSSSSSSSAAGGGAGGGAAPAAAAGGGAPGAGNNLRRTASDAGDTEPNVRRQRSSSSIGIAPDDVNSLPSVMKVFGACNEEGLGLVSWWASS